MLDGQLEHIVLVHYREVKEGHRSGISHLLNTDQGTMNYAGGAQISSGIFPAQVNSLAHAAQPSYASSPSTANWNGAQSSELEDADSGDDYGASSLSRPISCSGFQISSLHVDNSTVKNASGNGGLSESSRKQLTTGLFGGTSFNPEDFSSTWSESLIASMHEHKNLFGHTNGADFISRKQTNSTLGPCLQTFTRDTAQVHLNEERFEHVDFPSGMQGNNFNLNPQFENKGVSRVSITTSEQSLGLKAEGHHSTKKAPESSLCDHEVGLKKLDSFGRWMNKEIGKDCDDSLMASDSCNYWNTLDPQNDEKEVSSLSCHMQLHVDSLGPSLSQEQLFSILDFSPDWSYSRVETKVLITGTFLGGVEHPRNTNWCCMFGEVEVSAEVLTNNALRCQAPAHGPGRVPFYITCSNRLACSEVREFEYREKPSGPTYSIAVKSEPQDEIRLQIRLAKMLSPRIDKNCFESFDCSAEQCEKCSLKKNILSMRGDDGSEWGMVQKAAKASEGNIEHPRDALIQKLLRDRLYEWLVCKTHEEGKGPNVLDDDGQGVIHLAAALGYDWAMDPIVAAGVSPSFRDTRGRTGLHWAAYFGREETVVSLLRLGAAPGAVEDPTSSFPEERTAADLASSRGHKGIAGYLAEADLTSHLSSLRLKDSIIDGVSATATLAAEKTIEIIGEHAIVPLDGDKESLSLKGSLAAMRNSAQAAARIQAAFRLNSFRHTRSTECNDANELVALVSLNNRSQKVGHFSDSLHAAAIRIQQKYRGWKGRNEFLKMRSRIVKIQAHVRGHQVRKQYKKVVWSVSIVEKAILRWRRKGAGLRGFRADKAIEDSDPKSGKIDEYDFLRVGRKQKFAVVEKALARVQSMVRHPEARDQYMRLATNSQKSKMMANEGNESSKN